MHLGDRFVRELANRFNEINDQFNLLNWIDREIIESSHTIEGVVGQVLSRSVKNFRATAASAYVIADQTVLPFPAPESVAPISLDGRLSKRIADNRKVSIFSDKQAGKAWLILPVVISGITSMQFALVYEAPWYGGETSSFHDDDTKSFATMVSDQTAILISKKIDAEWHQVRDRAEEAYFSGVTRTDALSVEHRWYDLAMYFRQFLPNWEPLKIEPEPQIQILTYDGKENTILLRAGTNEVGPSLAKTLYVRDTICGLLIENEIHKGIVDEPLYVDPTDKAVRARYRSYLLKTIPKSELVIPIRWSQPGEPKKTIALVNLEHSAPRAFSQSHIEILRRAVDLITPYAAALIHEEEEQRARDVAHAYLLHGILAKMATTYIHKVGQRITAATLSLEALEALGTRLEGDERKFFDRLSRSVFSFAELSGTFVSDLPNYVRFTKTALLPLVEAALSEFDPAEMKRAEEIVMTLEVAPEVDAETQLQVFGSPMIREHVYNILHNSVFAVREQLKAGLISEGYVSTKLYLYEENQFDLMGRKDSFPFVVVKVEDNGGGLPPAVEARYGEFGNTRGKMDGSGYGVAAAREYLITIGGAFKWGHYTAKTGNRGLWQELCFPKYDPEVHIAMATNFFGQSASDGGRNG